MLRVTIRRVFEDAAVLSKRIEASRDPEDRNAPLSRQLEIMSRSLSTLPIAGTRLADMLRAQEWLAAGSDDPLEDLIGHAPDVLERGETG